MSCARRFRVLRHWPWRALRQHGIQRTRQCLGHAEQQKEAKPKLLSKVKMEDLFLEGSQEEPLALSRPSTPTQVLTPQQVEASIHNIADLLREETTVGTACFKAGNAAKALYHFRITLQLFRTCPQPVSERQRVWMASTLATIQSGIGVASAAVVTPTLPAATSTQL